MALKRDDWRAAREFNSPAEIRARLAHLLCLAALPAGVLLMVAGLLTRRLPLLAGGLAALSLGWQLRDGLRRSGRLDSAAAAFEAVPKGGAGAEADDSRLARFVDLLREWDALEKRRGTAAFDPWALQAVRNDISALIEADPALLGLFRTHRAAA